jgi:heterodisulfide reductase subunit A-like polyferredoxin
MKKPKYIPDFKDIPSPRAEMPELPLEERHLNFEVVELGFSEEQALAEASRCLSCRRCIGCGLCLAECDDCAIVYEETAAGLTLEADALIYAGEAEVYNPGSKTELGYENSSDVITSMEFERLASAVGPLGGVIVRPFDGRIPGNIAFIQCVGSREEGIGANFCSTVCCSRTLSQAEAARRLIEDVRVTVIHRGMRPVGKDGERIFRRLAAESWMDFVAGRVEEIKEDPESGNVKVKYAGVDGEKEGEFDLVVLAVGVRARREFGSIARRAGLGTNRYKFVDLKPGNMSAPVGCVNIAGDSLGPSTVGRSIIESIAAASRSLGGGGAGSAEAGGVRGLSEDARPVVFACRYGLELMGSGARTAEDLKAMGIEVEGILPFLCYRRGREAMAGRVGPGRRLIVVGCHSGSHERLFESVLGMAPGSVSVIGGESVNGDLAAAVAERASGVGEAPGPPVGRDRPVAVLGGGVAGLAAAAELARRGVSVVIVEKTAQVGSFLKDAGDNDEERETVAAFLKGVEENDTIKVMKSASLESLERDGGGVSLGVKTGKGRETLEASCVIIATGAAEYKPDESRYGGSDRVISQKEFRAMLDRADAGLKRIVMLQCVGARDDEHPYCSRYCCGEAIANALACKSAAPESEITILHRGIRVYGFEEDAFTDAIDAGVEFVEIEGEAAVEHSEGLKVAAKTAGSGAVEIEPDILVLSLAHTHEGANTEVSKITGADLDDLGFFAVARPLEAPLDTSLPGVFVCGFAREPLTMVEAFNDGVAAAGTVCRYLEDHGGS